MKFANTLIAMMVAQPVFAERTFVDGLPPYSEAILPFGSDVFAIAIGPGGPGLEFGSQATNGGLYKLDLNGRHEPIRLSDNEGLRNPTGLIEVEGQFILVDGNQVISLSPDGKVSWRRVYREEGAFFYDIEKLNDTTLLVSDFGRGRFVSVSVQSGEVQPFLMDAQINGLARFEIVGDEIYAISWGSDDAWDSAVHRISDIEETGISEKLAGGFGNLESVEVVDGVVIVGGYRGHEKHQGTKVMRVNADGTVHPLEIGSDTQGVSDIIYDGEFVWLNYFYDAAFAKWPAKRVKDGL